MWLGAAIGGALGIASTVLSNKSAKSEAERNRNWQEDMSNTSIQRRVEDLKAAGLNPLLAVSSASSGASTPTGSQAQIQKFNPADISALASARLVSAQAKAQEQENSLYDFRKEQIQLENERQREGVLSDRVIRELNSAKTLETKANIYLKEAQKQGIYMDLDKAKREIQLLDFKVNDIANTPFAQEIKFVSDAFGNPTKAVGSILGGLGGFSSRAISGIMNYFDKSKRSYKSRDVDERRISR